MEDRAMTRDALLERLVTARAAFDERVAAIPATSLDVATPGSTHSPVEIVVHITAYEQLIVERLVTARHGATTAFDRDRVGWEAFNETTWREAEGSSVSGVIARAADTFRSLVREIEMLSDEELAAPVGATAALDPAWLEGRSPADLIAIDAYDHYPMHHAALEAAAGD
jgi:hypothetical protein